MDNEIAVYHQLLCDEDLAWLEAYIKTPAMQRLKGVSMNCGTDYSPLFSPCYMYDTLSHSIGVARILWHFSHDRSMTLCGLFHDIATPSFKHCIDFMYGDASTQEATEALTSQLISQSNEIMALLKRDGIALEAVNEDRLYPLANNPTPRLSADRLEYTFSSGLGFYRIWDLQTIQEIYGHMQVFQAEDGQPEIGFDDLATARTYVHQALKLWQLFVSEADRAVMQFWADLFACLVQKGYFQAEMLYRLSEREILTYLETLPDPEIQAVYQAFRSCRQVFTSTCPIPDHYCIQVSPKKRYILPLVMHQGKLARLDTWDEEIALAVEAFRAQRFDDYVCFNFDFPWARTKNQA